MEQFEHQRRLKIFWRFSNWFSVITTDGKNLYYKSFRVDSIIGKIHLEFTGKIPFPKQKIEPEDIIFEPMFFDNVITITFKKDLKAYTLILDKTSNFCYKEFHNG